jgi:hypothetical protein
MDLIPKSLSDITEILPQIKPKENLLETTQFTDITGI